MQTLAVHRRVGGVRMAQVMKPRVRHDSGHVASLDTELVERPIGQRFILSFACEHPLPGSRVNKTVQQLPCRFSDSHLVVREESAPINGMGRLVIGSKPIDGGNYIFDEVERAAFLDAEPEAARWLRLFIGAREYLQGGERWILALHDARPEVLARLPGVRERIAAVRAYREASKSAPTRKLAATPTLYHVNVLPTAPFLVIPEVSSERREYAPIGWLEPPVIPSNLVRILENATLVDFALLTSAIHMAWLRHIGGRLKSDYRYSIGLVYNWTLLTKVETSCDQNPIAGGLHFRQQGPIRLT